MASFTWPTFIDRWTVGVYVIHLWSVVVNQLICPPPFHPSNQRPVVPRLIFGRQSVYSGHYFRKIPMLKCQQADDKHCLPMVGLLSDDGRTIVGRWSGVSRRSTQLFQRKKSVSDAKKKYIHVIDPDGHMVGRQKKKSILA